MRKNNAVLQAMSVSLLAGALWMLAGFLFLLPTFAGAAGLVPCGDKGEAQCGFNDLIKLANEVVNFLVYGVCIPLAALGFAWAGGSLVIFRDKEGAWTEAKGRFEYIGLGFFWILAAFVMVKAFLYAFLNTDAGFTAFLLE